MYASRNDKSSYVLLEELWNEQTNSFYSGTATELLNLLGNKSGTTIEEIIALANQTKKASDLRTNTYKKKNTQDINVMLGGLEWTVCYLSTDKNGDPILTLWLSNSTQDKFYGRAKDEGGYYGYYQGGLYSRWQWTDTADGWVDELPCNLYSTSYIRAVTLNAGGGYALNKNQLASTTQSEENVFSIYTMPSVSTLSNYLVTPNYVSWQEYQSAYDLGKSLNSSNDAWGVMPDDHFGKTVDGKIVTNLSNNPYNAIWKDDYIWLPSRTEIFYMWGLSAQQKLNYNGVDSYIDCSVGELAKTSVTTCSWLRSAYYSYSTYNFYINQSGVGGSQMLNRECLAIRPALHLNLKSVAESLEKENLYTLNYNYEITNEDYLQVGVYPTCMGVTDEFSLTNPVCSGYKFLGWRVENGLNSETARYGTSSATESIVDENTECSVGNSKKMYFSGLGVSGGTVTLKALWQSTGEISVIYKSYNDYFTDYNISKSTITEDDLIGTGTSTDPYIVKTTRGFLYLTNKAISGISLENKYVEINCDIVLNDEVFDSNGIPTSGDGIVYSWEPISSGRNCSLDGKNHTIWGLYYKNFEKDNFALFDNKKINSMKNLKMNDVFVWCNAFSSTFAHDINEIENCHTLSGTLIVPSGNSSGLVYYVYEKMSNCSNSLTIFGGNSTSGVFSGASQNVIINSVINYGKVVGGINVAGIMADPGGALNIKLSNCLNFGEISGKDRIGGILGHTYSNRNTGGELFYCKNYGKIYVANGELGAGIFSSLEENWILVGCENHAEIYSNRGGSGSLIGRIYFAENIGKQSVVELINCKSYVKQNIPIIYNITDWGHGKIIIDGLNAKYYVLENVGRLLVRAEYLKDRDNFTVKNSIFDVECGTFEGILMNTPVDLHNIILSVKCNNLTTRTNYFFSGTKSGTILTSTLVNINSKASQVKQYYGTNFRDFYMSWKYGTIGLKTLDGVGSAQGSITTAWLEENGWVKKG